LVLIFLGEQFRETFESHQCIFLSSDNHSGIGEFSGQSLNEPQTIVSAMESWHAHGLLAFTINMQGGSPLGDGNKGWINSAIDTTGELRADYMTRLERILDRANELGMVVILGLFYNGQEDLLNGETAVVNGVDHTIDWLFEKNYRHVIIEVNNECNLKYRHDILGPERVPEVVERIKSKTQHGYRYLVGTS
jgi:hypothetical protein